MCPAKRQLSQCRTSLKGTPTPGKTEPMLTGGGQLSLQDTDAPPPVGLEDPSSWF